MTCKNCSPTAPQGTQIDEMQPSGIPAAPEPSPRGGPTGIRGVRTRDFPMTWETTPSVQGPMGAMNPGYTHNVVSTNGQWARGELPPLGYGYTFALRRPALMREPGTNLGTVNLANG